MMHASFHAIRWVIAIPGLTFSCLFAEFAQAVDNIQNKDAQVDTRPLPVSIQPAFPRLHWAGWSPEGENGRVMALRPILVTHAGDGSKRIFVPTQRGVVHVVSDRNADTESKVFLDISSHVSYRDDANEEGFLGLTFHPRFKDNGEFFVYYTNRSEPRQNIVSRFRVSSQDMNVADPTSEEVLMVIDKPYWNHDGGTICFGHDGYLYIAIGDGGAGGDPHGNGQNLGTWLGKILRIDIDRSTAGAKYAIPEDNPFANRKDARPEIWAYGLRNVWRMAFDPETNRLWAGDVGQDLWEEINLVTRGGNFGWSVREGKHPFGPRGKEATSDLIDPVWEYSHDVGKSIIGGLVYRHKKPTELHGAYLYADFVSCKLWGLWYDHDQQQVIANREIPLSKTIPIVSFGEDESGQVYFMSDSPDGKGIYTFASE